MGARLDRITGDLAIPEEKGDRVTLAAPLGGVVCAMDLLMATARIVPMSMGVWEGYHGLPSTACSYLT